MYKCTHMCMHTNTHVHMQHILKYSMASTYAHACTHIIHRFVTFCHYYFSVFSVSVKSDIDEFNFELKFSCGILKWYRCRHFSIFMFNPTLLIYFWYSKRKLLIFVTAARWKFILQFRKSMNTSFVTFTHERIMQKNWYSNVVLKEVLNLSIEISTHSFSQSNISINIWFENWTREDNMSVRKNENSNT